MPKAKPHPNQLGFSFEVPQVAEAPGGLAGIEQRISGMVGTILASDGRPREVIAAEMSVLLGDDISKDMLNAYSSPARVEHKVIFSRLLALVAVTKRHDLLDPIMREIGCALVVGDEIKTARLGHIDQQIRTLQDQRKKLLGAVPLIRESGGL